MVSYCWDPLPSFAANLTEWEGIVKEDFPNEPIILLGRTTSRVGEPTLLGGCG